MSNDMVVEGQGREESQFLPVMQVAQAVAMYKQFSDFVKSALRTGVDVATIPGCPKPSLMKAGAEKLSKFFGLSPSFELVSKIEDWVGTEHGGQPLFNYTYRATLYRNGVAMGMCEGSCNSWEDKFRYRTGQRKCPQCGKETIIKGNEKYGGGWLCYQKKGGCGAKYKDGDRTIENQESGKVLNLEPFTLVNTIQKQAQKRAFVGAVLIACNASDYFTQDLEEMAPDKSDDADNIPEPTMESAKPTPPKEPKKHTPADVVAVFEKLGVTQKQLEIHMQQVCEDWGEAGINILRNIYKQLKGGEKTVAEVFPS